MDRSAGRFAPSPSGPLHLGNLRTALIAWLVARSRGADFLVRMEDIDRATSSAAHETAQLQALATIGLDWDGAVVRQSERLGLYRDAIATLDGDDRTYECFCTRREIQNATRAPHDTMSPDGAYPGTCRSLSSAARRVLLDAGRPPALRLRTSRERIGFVDEFVGPVAGHVDDVVLRRNDGAPSYNLAVVVDDAAQDVDHVVRGDDLIASTPRQILLQRLLGLATPRYAHVPLVVGPDGVRLAKRHGAATLADLAAVGLGADEVVSLLARSIGLAAAGATVTVDALVDRFDLHALPRDPWILPARLQRSIS